MVSFAFARAPLAAALLSAVFAPAAAQACACGCGVFDIGGDTVMPMTAADGVTVFYRLATMAQGRNHEGGHAADPADNHDKRIATDFHTLGAEVRIGHAWTVMAEVPIYARRFTTTGSDANGNDVIETVPLTATGDAVLRASWTGLARDMRTGLTLGVKLPTGRWHGTTDRYGNAVYDRDTLPGTGSTDLQVGAWHVGGTPVAALRWFVQGQFQFAVAKQGGYRPGNEGDGALGVSYDLPDVGRVHFAPVLQLLGSLRGRDSGSDSDPFNSGYKRLLIAPGLRVQVTRRLALYGDVEVPLAQDVNAASADDIASGRADSRGQLVAPVQFKLQVSYGF